MSLSNALLHSPPRSIDLGALPPLRLREHGQQDDPPPRRDPIRHPHRSSGEKEPRLAELAVELARVRLVQQQAELGQPVDTETGPPLRLLIEPEVPVPNGSSSTSADRLTLSGVQADSPPPRPVHLQPARARGCSGVNVSMFATTSTDAIGVRTRRPWTWGAEYGQAFARYVMVTTTAAEMDPLYEVLPP